MGVGLPEEPAAFANLGASTALPVGDDVLVRLNLDFEGSRTARVFRLSDGKQVYATNIAGDCIFYSAPDNAPLVFSVYLHNPNGLVVGRGREDGSSVAWTGALPDPGVFGSTFEWSVGSGFTLVDGTVRVLASTDAKDLTTIDQRPVPSYHSAGYGDLVLWSVPTGVNNDSLRGFSTGNAVSTFVTADAGISSVAISKSHVVWAVVRGPRQGDGTYTSAQIYYSPVVSKPEDIVATPGPTLAITADLLQLVSAGDFAATMGCNSVATPACSLIVVKLSTGSIWNIHFRPGSVFNKVLAMSNTDVLLSEADASNPLAVTRNIQRLVRLSLSHLDELASAW
jgi:hypothetical protein